jgi:hypothetical protein
MSSLQQSPSGALPSSVFSFSLLRNTLFYKKDLPADAVVLAQRFFEEYEGEAMVHLLQDVTFAVTESTWFDNMDANQRNTVIWELRHLEEFMGLLSTLIDSEA